jgi:hypothetical protein
MALKLNYEKSIEGFPSVSAKSYCKIDRVTASKASAVAFVLYLSEDKSIVLGSKEISFTPSVAEGSKNFIAQAYDYVKTLSEFLNAENG